MKNILKNKMAHSSSKFKLGIGLSLLTVALSGFSAIPDQMAPVKNVIFLIPDGMSITGSTLTRLYHNEPLALEPHSIAMIKTWSSDGTIADSAPAGSALATGWKSQTGNIASTGGVYLEGQPAPGELGFLRPVATIIESANLKGMATGIVSSSEFMHATPADFSSHDPSRKSYDNLTEQIIHNNLDVILGGGKPFLDWKQRKDYEDMIAAAKEQGFEYIDTLAKLESFEGEKILGVFGADDKATSLSNHFDRDPAIEPSLAQLTEKAIDVLSKDSDGFFLMVEGSKIDWSAHANDPIGIISEVTGFNEATKVALDFAKQDGNTLVISVADHGNSGIAIIGNGDTSQLRTAKITAEKFASLVNKLDKNSPNFEAQILAIANENYGITELSQEELDNIKANPSYGIGPIVGKMANIAFTTNGHTGEDITLYSYDPRGKILTGLIDNTDVAKFIAHSLELDLVKTTDEIFINAQPAFDAINAKAVVNSTDTENPYLEVTKGNQTLQIPRNKNYVCVNGERKNSNGINVFNGEDWFVSKVVIDLVK